ncbi:MAG TPA: TonB family protein [Thermoanaerobaculia bacterium]|jgi:protein TonB
MFDDVLIESAGKDKQKGGWITALISTVIHAIFVGAIIAAGYYVKENPEVLPKPMAAFVVASAPPPPPPPPPPASNSGARSRTVEVVRETPQQREFRQPTEVPVDIPPVADTPSSGPEDAAGGVPGGVAGGVEGGVVGGVHGGVIGGVVGGELGGLAGGQVGGTGDAVRVGGNVRAPVTIERVQPDYTESARRARVQGIVIVEAVIDRQGDVTEARVLKPLPMGLDQQALAAVRQWKFKPGTLNGQPVPVYWNLTINFRLE